MDTTPTATEWMDQVVARLRKQVEAQGLAVPYDVERLAEAGVLLASIPKPKRAPVSDEAKARARRFREERKAGLR